MADKNLTFEQAMERLENNVKALESGELSLDDVLKVFEEGVGLIRTCRQKLDDAEQKIEILLSSLEDAQKEEGR
ncbi:MAG: exodeoxyribonuclease VII small subunit [Bacillota bacterium]|jgi:exodeoxyribonuclease VII small subunit|nr:exodeoxyribonuclease VII small subunit [Clostridia bacterium]